MFKSIAAVAGLTSVATAVAAIGGVVTSVSVVRGNTPNTAAAVTLGATGVAVAGTLVNIAMAHRAMKKLDEQLNAATEAAQQA